MNDLIIAVDRSLKKNSEKNKEIIFEENLPMIGTSSVMQIVYKNIAKITKQISQFSLMANLVQVKNLLQKLYIILVKELINLLLLLIWLHFQKI